MEKKINKKVKLHIKQGDTVKVIAGDSKGKTGKVLSIETGKEKALVEGVNIVSKHTKPSAKSPEGGIVKQEAPIHISNLQLINPATGEGTKVGRKLDDKGKLKRYSKKTGEFI
ncbi:MAG TPA: 50S ribosomal protein L24 [Cytophagales bacterium]|nr:50S ribosomal protein L24 [Cytophagales bacterium]